MSDDHKEQEIGRVVQRRMEIVKRLKDLDIAARRLGALFKLLGATLETTPQNIVFDNDGQFAGDCPVRSTDLDLPFLRALTKEYRALLREKASLDRKVGR
jgi:hypothetical protein